MESTQSTSAQRFVRRLATALPLNLAFFWLTTSGDFSLTFVYGSLGGLCGALLLTMLQTQTPATQSAAAFPQTAPAWNRSLPRPVEPR